MSEIQEEIPGIEMDNNDNAEMEFHEPDQDEDLNDLAVVSTENADEGKINEKLPTNQSHNETGSEGDWNHESESHGVDSRRNK